MTTSTDTNTDTRIDMRTATRFDGPSILANARAIAPVLRDEAAPSERERELTRRAVDALRSTGVFRMSMPRAWGGPEVDLATQIEIIEALARADGSAGWCAMIGSDGGFLSAALDDEVARRLFHDLDAPIAGFIQQPVGRLDAVAGGYRLSGRWPFASGCTHAGVIVAAGLVFDDDALVMGPDGFPEHRIAMLPADRFRIVDTWHTTGLAGSGSHHVEIDDGFVPAEQTFVPIEMAGRRAGTLYSWPGAFVHQFVGVPLGIARGALDAAEEILADKVLQPEMRPARDNSRVRENVARAEAMVGSCRSYVLDVTAEFWAELGADRVPSNRQRAALSGSWAHTARSCHEAVQLLADTVGSSSIHRANPLERRLRDLTTLRQHIVAQARSLELAGGLWIDGADVNNWLVNQHLI
jgi:indole-3-acetate monooxygenase